MGGPPLPVIEDMHMLHIIINAFPMKELKGSLSISDFFSQIFLFIRAKLNNPYFNTAIIFVKNIFGFFIDFFYKLSTTHWKC